MGSIRAATDALTAPVTLACVSLTASPAAQ